MSGLKRYMSRGGFTIIELLVVIAVIGILASITAVTYNGAQERARNGTRLSAVEQAKEIVEIALTKKTPLELRASLNLSDGWYRACIGTGHADINADTKGDCAAFNNVPYVSESAAFNTILSEAATLPSMASYPESTSNDGDVVFGPYFGSAWVDSTDMLVLEYSLGGEGQKCGFSPLVYKNGGTPSLTPTGSPDYSASEQGVTECVLVIVDKL